MPTLTVYIYYNKKFTNLINNLYSAITANNKKQALNLSLCWVGAQGFET